MTGQFLKRWLEDSVKSSVRPATYSMYWHLTTRHLIPNLERIPLDSEIRECGWAVVKVNTWPEAKPRAARRSS